MAAHDHRVRDPLQTVATLRTDLICTRQQFSGKPCYLIEDPLRAKFYRLGIAEFTFATYLDGTRTVADALGLAAGSLGPQALDEGEVLAICRWLVENQLALTAASQAPDRTARTARLAAGARWRLLANPVAMRVPLGNPDAVLERSMPWLEWIWSWPAAAVWLLVCSTGAYQVYQQWDAFAAGPAVVLAPGNWLRLAIIWVLLKLVHETAHAVACKRYGGNVTSAGVMFILLAPVAFVDVTSCWRFSSKWHRMAVAAAGMLAELFCAGLADWLWAMSGPGTCKALAHDTVWLAGWTTLLVNANPLIRFDGYFILADWLEIPNLAAAGRQALAAVAAKWFMGIDLPQPERSKRERRTVLAYAIGSLIWRSLLAVLIAVAAVAVGSYLGGLLVLVWVAIMFVVPNARRALSFYRQHAHELGVRKRLVRSSMLTFAAVLLVSLCLARPATVSLPAVAEYAPLHVVRSGTGGFVRRVLVEDGQAVAAGTPLVELANEPLEAELAELKLQVAQSVLKERMHEQNDERAKAQAERAERAALEQRLTDVGRRVADLLVRAPAAGQVLRPGLANLPGQYLKAGDEVLAIGRSDAKEFWLAVPQDDIELLTAHRGQTVRLRLPYAPTLDADLRVGHIEPRASIEPAHPALSAHQGGPLAVVASPRPETDSRRASQTYELLSPHFLAKVPVPPALAEHVYSGQLATAEFTASGASIASRWYLAVRGWIERQIDLPRRG